MSDAGKQLVCGSCIFWGQESRTSRFHGYCQYHKIARKSYSNICNHFFWKTCVQCQSPCSRKKHLVEVKPSEGSTVVAQVKHLPMRLYRVVEVDAEQGTVVLRRVTGGAPGVVPSELHTVEADKVAVVSQLCKNAPQGVQDYYNQKQVKPWGSE